MAFLRVIKLSQQIKRFIGSDTYTHKSVAMNLTRKCPTA
jgi:hypothetical protein